MKKLLLANNNITCNIPKKLASMPALELLDVSNNSLHGKIPSFHGNVVVKINGNPDLEKKKKLGGQAIVGVVMGIVGLLGG
ncbi:putative receptor protein kinase TMK1-like, partial [Trifolium medium]|nr:putative receptor protein kinase TMK1-like [Trifolium medium]